MKGKVHWYYDTLTPKMAVFEIVIDEAIEYIVEEIAKELESYMREEAPWEDQTGAARDGLRAEASKEGSTHLITLYHTVDYGIWLEVRYNKKFAIILPTIEKYGPVLMGALGGTYEVAK